MNETGMQWENPPNKARGRGGGQPSYAKESGLLRKQPLEWAVIKQFPVKERKRANSFGASIKNGKFVAFRPAGTFDAITRTVGDFVKVYVRCIGEK